MGKLRQWIDEVQTLLNSEEQKPKLNTREKQKQFSAALQETRSDIVQC